MTITIDLPTEVADGRTHKAVQEGREVAGYTQQIAVRDSADTQRERLCGLYTRLACTPGGTGLVMTSMRPSLTTSGCLVLSDR